MNFILMMKIIAHLFLHHYCLKRMIVLLSLIEKYKRYGNEYPLESYNNGVSRLKYQEDYNKIKQEFKNNNNIDKDDEKNPILRKFKKTTKGPLFIATKFHGGKIKKSKKTKRKSLKKRRKTKRKSLKKRRKTRRR